MNGSLFSIALYLVTIGILSPVNVCATRSPTNSQALARHWAPAKLSMLLEKTTSYRHVTNSLGTPAASNSRTLLYVIEKLYVRLNFTKNQTLKSVELLPSASNVKFKSDKRILSYVFKVRNMNQLLLSAEHGLPVLNLQDLSQGIDVRIDINKPKTMAVSYLKLEVEQW